VAAPAGHCSFTKAWIFLAIWLLVSADATARPGLPR